MYTIKRTKIFEKSFKKVKSSGLLKPIITKKLISIIDTLALGKPLPKENKDHALLGDYREYRECHVKGDLLLIYKIEENELILVDIGSHSYLFG